MTYIPFFVAFALLFAGIPVGLALLTSGLLYFGFLAHTLPMTSIIQNMIQNCMSTGLLTIPMFLFMGTVMNYCGLTARLLDWCNALVGHRKGGLAQVNVLLSTVNGGICGSSGADAAMQCKILVPEMVKKGYPIEFATAVTAASGLIAPMIPPGNALILYSTMTDISCVRMFMAGYLPGFLMCIAEMITVAIICNKNNYQSRAEKASWKEILIETKRAFWALVAIILLIVGLRFGFFNVHEGAVATSGLCIIVGLFIYKTITVSDIPKMFIEAFHTTSNIMIMLMGSMVFGFYLTWARIPQNLATFIMHISSSKYVFMILSCVLMLIMGMFMDGTAMLMIVTPLLYPIAQKYGINLIHFGIIELICGYIGSLTPPVGGVMYTCCNITKVAIPDFFKAVKPFILALLFVLLSVVFVPQISTLLPTAVYGPM